MEQYTMEDVSRMTYAELGVIEDPAHLMATGGVAPMLIRYIVRTGQLDNRFPGISLTMLLSAIGKAAAKVEWPIQTVAQLVPQAVQNTVVDQYLDTLQPHVQTALKSAH